MSPAEESPLSPSPIPRSFLRHPLERAASTLLLLGLGGLIFGGAAYGVSRSNPVRLVNDVNRDQNILAWAGLSLATLIILALILRPIGLRLGARQARNAAFLLCPRCRGPLLTHDNAAFCRSCRERFDSSDLQATWRSIYDRS